MDDSSPVPENDCHVTPQVVAVAIEFVRALPPHYPLPEIAPNEAEEVSLEWNVSDTKSASISINEGRRLSCVCLDGDDYEYGTDYLYDDGIPSRVLDAIWRIVADSSFTPSPEKAATEENLKKLSAAAGQL